MPQSVAIAIQNIGFLTALRESALMYPIVISSHLAFIALFGGLILMTDLRLLGFALTKWSISDVIDGLRPWKRLGGTLMITFGLLLGTCEMDKYHANPYFWTKIVLLVCVGIHALVFRPTVYNNAAALDKLPTPPRRAKVAATLSLVMWISIACCGRWIAYYEDPALKATITAAPR